MKTIINKIPSAAVYAGAVIFSTVTPVLAQDLDVPAPVYGADNIGNLIGALINFAIIIAALAAFGFLILGGIQWITSGGDKAAYESARGRITAALIGLAIVAAAYAIFTVVGEFFNVDVLDPSGINFPTVKSPTGA